MVSHLLWHNMLYCTFSSWDIHIFTFLSSNDGTCVSLSWFNSMQTMCWMNALFIFFVVMVQYPMKSVCLLNIFIDIFWKIFCSDIIPCFAHNVLVWIKYFPRDVSIALTEHMFHSIKTHLSTIPDSKVRVASIVPTWVLSAPGAPHVGPMNLAIRDDTSARGCITQASAIYNSTIHIHYQNDNLLGWMFL